MNEAGAENGGRVTRPAAMRECILKGVPAAAVFLDSCLF